jgi:hypothetical protein
MKIGFIKEMNISLQFNDFDATVGNYRGINVKSDDKGSSIITLVQAQIKPEWSNI